MTQSHAIYTRKAVTLCGLKMSNREVSSLTVSAPVDSLARLKTRRAKTPEGGISCGKMS